MRAQAGSRTSQPASVRISVADFIGQLEWAIDIDGVLWAAGDCESVEDGERQARACLAKAGILAERGRGMPPRYATGSERR